MISIRNSKRLLALAAALVIALSAGITATAYAAPRSSGDAMPRSTETSATPADRPEIFPHWERGTATSTDRPEGGKREGVYHVDMIEIAASTLGVTKDELIETLKTAGLYETLEAANKVDEFKAAWLDATKAQLNEAVTSGKLSQEKADEMYTLMKERIDAFDETSQFPNGMKLKNKNHDRATPNDASPTASAGARARNFK